MKTRQLRGETHYAYEGLQEFRLFYPDVDPVYWKEAEEGDWALLDDGGIAQVLKRGNIGNSRTRFVRTICGMDNPDRKNSQYYTEIAEDLWSFAKKVIPMYKQGSKRKTPNYREVRWVYLIMHGMTPQDAYLKVYPTEDEDRALERSKILFKFERIQNLVKANIQKKLDELGADKEWIIKKYKEMVDESKLDKDKLKALDRLADMQGLRDTTEESRTSAYAYLETTTRVTDKQLQSREDLLKRMEELEDGAQESQAVDLTEDDDFVDAEEVPDGEE